MRLTGAIDGVVDVVDRLTHEEDDTTPEYQRYWRRPAPRRTSCGDTRPARS